MTTVSDKDYDGKLHDQAEWDRKGDAAESTGIRDQIKKVLKQPQYDDGSAGPVFVRYVPSPCHTVR